MGDLKMECLAIPVGSKAYSERSLCLDWISVGVQRFMCVRLWVLLLSFNYDFLSKLNPQRTFIDRALKSTEWAGVFCSVVVHI